MPYLESHLPIDANYADYIEKADFRLLRAILTYYVRQERFQEGLWTIVLGKMLLQALNEDQIGSNETGYLIGKVYILLEQYAIYRDYHL